MRDWHAGSERKLTKMLTKWLPVTRMNGEVEPFVRRTTSCV